MAAKGSVFDDLTNGAFNLNRRGARNLQELLVAHVRDDHAGVWFMVWDFGFEVDEFGVWGLGFMSSGFEVWGLGCGVYDAGFMS